MTDLHTHIDLYNFFQNDNVDFESWIRDEWKGKNKQESSFRLFSALGLIDKLTNYDPCSGNFNDQSIEKMKTLYNFFYKEKNQPRKLKDKSDSSDMTFIEKNNNKHILASTSKCTPKNQIGKLDLEKISFHSKPYLKKDYIVSFCIVVPSRDELTRMKDRCEKTNKRLKDIVERDDTIVIDKQDLVEAYHQFMRKYGNKPLKEVLSENTNTHKFVLKLHQRVSVTKTSMMKQNGALKVLWGHIPRSGKSYIMTGSIIEDSRNKTMCNYIIITTAPNETIDQYLNVLDCPELNDFNIIYLHGKNKKPQLKNKNIIICSKQFLQSKVDGGKFEEKTKIIQWLKNIAFDMRFLDESHYGGSTELSQKTLDTYGRGSFTVQMTATYTKPANNYNIPRNNWILWDLEDVSLCKTIQNNIPRLIEKHGTIFKDILDEYSFDNIVDEYSKYPRFEILTHKISPEIVDELKQHTQDNKYGWSTEACFLLKQGYNKTDKTITFKPEFQNENETLKMWHTIFGLQLLT